VLLRVEIAAFDLLRELDLLRCAEQRMARRLAQEQLQRVRRRLDGGVERSNRKRLALVVDELHATPLELVVQRV
jgi:hypothetical protein